MSYFNIEELDNGTAKIHALNYIQNIQAFIEPLYKRHPLTILLNAVGKFDEFRSRIENNLLPLKDMHELDEYLLPILNGTLQHNPRIAVQLRLFWDAHREMIKIANERKLPYEPFKSLDKNKEIIEKINMRFETVVQKFITRSNDEVYINSLLYMHILRTETLGKRLISQFKELLKTFGLAKGFEPADVYSVSSKIPVTKKGKTEYYLTDAEAIRHALAHNNYDIIFNKDTWNITFDNKEEHDYKYNKTFEKMEFLRYLDDIEILYKATQVLINASILREIARRYLVKHTDYQDPAT